MLPLLLQCFVPGAVSQMSSADQSGHGAASSISTAASNPSSPCASPALLGEPTVVFVQAAPQKPSSTQVPAVQCRGSFIIPGVSIPSLHEALCCYSLPLSIHLTTVFSLSKLCLISPSPPYFLGTTLSAAHLSTLMNYPQPMITGWLCLLHVLCLH